MKLALLSAPCPQALHELLAAVKNAPQPPQQQQPRIFVNMATVLPSTVARQAADAAVAGLAYVNW